LYLRSKLHTTSRYIAAVPDYYQRAMDGMGAALTELARKAADDKTATEVGQKWSALTLVK